MPGEVYRMAGGAPAGIIRLPGEVGCQTKITIKITIMKKIGVTMTIPIGTIIFDL